MITVHHLNNSRSQRVSGCSKNWACLTRSSTTSVIKRPCWRRRNCVQFIRSESRPVITDNGKTIAESGAIVEYLVDTYGQGKLKPPAGSDERLRYTYWLHFAEGTAMPPLLIKLIVDRMESAKAPFFIKPVIRGIVGRVRKGFLDRQIASNLDFMEGELGKFEWFAGNEFTAADIQMSFPLEAASMRAGLDRSRPKLWDFLQRIHARPAYKRALEKGGKYELVK